MSYSAPRLPHLFRWYFQRELPGWGKLFSALNLGGLDNANVDWSKAPTVTTRGKWHGFLMELDLSNDLHRATYFLGRYYDLALQKALDCFLKPGDTFIDGGANVGMTMLHAARNVGPSGRIFCFEPLPENCAQIERLIALNNLSQVSLVPKAISDQPGDLTLNVLGGDTIMATLRPGANLSDCRKSVQVSVIQGDDYLHLLPSRHLFIKLDLEGWEYHALVGLNRIIEKFRPPVLIEIEPKYLREAGVDEFKLHEFFKARDYKPYVIGAKTKNFSPPELLLWGYQTAEELTLLNEPGSELFNKARSKLGRELKFIDILWVPSNYDRIGYLKHVISLED